MKDYRLVYSTDPKENQRCPRCKELLSECGCSAEAPIPDKITVRLRLEKSGRGGKTVTVAAGLPAAEEYLRDLASQLKRGCGCGGTFRTENSQGLIEVQGDKREAVRVILEKKGMRVKG